MQTVFYYVVGCAVFLYFVRAWVMAREELVRPILEELRTLSNKVDDLKATANGNAVALEKLNEDFERFRNKYSG